MERKFYTDDFEQLLKEKSDEFRMYPSKRVWHSIYNDLHPGRKWPSVAVSMFLIIALLMTGYWNSNSNDAVTSSEIAAVTPSVPLVAANNAEIAAFKAEDKNQHSTSPHNIKSTKNIIAAHQNIAYPFASVKRSSAIMAAFTGNNTKNTIDSNSSITNNLTSGEITINEITTITEDSKTAVIVTAPVIDAEVAEILNASLNNYVTGLTDNNTATAAKSNSTTSVKAKTTLSAQDKAWIEDYAFHNKSKRKPWKDRTTLDLYLTPNVTYRKLSNAAEYNLPSPANGFATSSPSGYANSAVDQKPGLGLEAGLGITYAVGKNFRIKAGIQANYTNYGVNADETNHPVLTTLMFINPETGYPYLSSSSSTLSNSSGLQSVRMHNKTYQFSIPMGMAFKIMGNEKLEFYAGASLQPTFVLGGKANLISADRKNYVADPSLIRKWNLNTGFETYINYKLDGFTLQAGPQFRYQLFSTYDKKYTVNENLYGMGIKVGILKNF